MSTEPFIAATETYRSEILNHCYRMVGAGAEAEDLVQETYLRAWRAWGGFAGRSSVRVWMHRIATNVCLDALNGRARRALPAGLGAPSDDPWNPAPQAEDVLWVEPLPDPADVAAAKATLRLALIACLQHLPPRQRAVLIFRDVLGWHTDDVAEALDMSVSAARSALQRARAQLSTIAPEEEDLVEPTEHEAKTLLDGYMSAFEQSDLSALERLLRADATLEAARSRTWFAGKAACLEYIKPYLGEPGDWRMIPTGANGQPAAAAYLHGTAFALVVLTVAPDGITGITLFTDTSLFARFGFAINYSTHPDAAPALTSAPAPSRDEHST